MSVLFVVGIFVDEKLVGASLRLSQLAANVVPYKEVLFFTVLSHSTSLQGYEGFVDVSKKIMQGRTTIE